MGGLLVPMALGLLGGCVNLDKPSAVEDCSSDKGPCVDGAKRDAGLPNQDVAGQDAGVDRTSPDARNTEDADAAPDVAGADRADAGLRVDTDRSPDSATPLADALQPDLRLAVYDTSTLPDTSPEAPQAALDAQPDVVDAAVADLGSDVAADAAPDLPPSDVPPTAAATITFKSGRAVATGVNGYGWVTLGAADTVTSPKCGAAGTAITAATPCAADIVWDNTSALCTTGTIPSLSASPDYATNWGIQIGTNLKEPLAAGGLAFKSVAINLTGVPASGLRLELHRSGDADGATYCALMTPGTLIPITKFNTKCWNDLGDALTEADAAKIDRIGVQVSSDSTDIAVTELCLQSIVLGQ